MASPIWITVIICIISVSASATVQSKNLYHEILALHIHLQAALLFIAMSQQRLKRAVKGEVNFHFFLNLIC